MEPAQRPRRVAIVMAGGSGERLWPLSTPAKPKQLLKLGGDDTLIEQALERLAPLFPPEAIFVATNSQIAASLSHPNLLVEPEPRNTLGALCWATAELLSRGYGEDTTMAVVTADHVIGDSRAFQIALETAMNQAEAKPCLVTIGIKPTRPETGFGYIESDPPAAQSAVKVASFKEKPDPSTAEMYATDGRHLWNSGMFFWRISSFLSELTRHCPTAAAAATDKSRFHEVPTESIDKALLEKSDCVYVVKGEFPWDDVGSIDALARVIPIDEAANFSIGPVTTIDTHNALIYNTTDIPIGVVGADNLAIILTPDGLLVCPREQAHRVRELTHQRKPKPQ